MILACALAACVPAAAQSSWSEAALDDLEAVAASAPLEGLPSESAALEELAQFRHLRDFDPAADAQTDVAADALFASLARSFAQGGADPAVADPDWAVPLEAPPDLILLEAARAAGALPAALLRPLLPQNHEYVSLRNELARLRTEPANAAREARIVQVRASMERWRWAPRELAPRRLEVRIPQFELRAITPDRPVVVHRVIVGALDSQTPSFTGEIASVTFNPSWEPPASIAAELLRRFRSDPAAAAREGFDVLTADGAVVAHGSVDWGARPFPYRLRQRPGPANALGRIRFDMANAFAIRLHDTPSRSLFDQEVRALSHGCIRVEAPETLAVDVLNSGDWTADAVNEAIESGIQQRAPLAQPTPVYLFYITAAANDAGEIAYADDIYRRDEAVVAALDAPDAALARHPAAAGAECSAGAAMP